MALLNRMVNLGGLKVTWHHQGLNPADRCKAFGKSGGPHTEHNTPQLTALLCSNSYPGLPIVIKTR